MKKIIQNKIFLIFVAVVIIFISGALIVTVNGRNLESNVLNSNSGNANSNLVSLVTTGEPTPTPATQAMSFDSLAELHGSAPSQENPTISAPTLTPGVLSSEREFTTIESVYVTRGELVQKIIEISGTQFNADGKQDFADVENGSTYYDAIETALHNGWIKVPSNGLFRPNDDALRSEVAQLLSVSRLTSLKCSPATRRVQYFKDVSRKSWFYLPVKRMTDCRLNDVPLGIKNKFEPNAKITRESLNTILQKYQAIAIQ